MIESFINRKENRRLRIKRKLYLAEGANGMKWEGKME